MGVLFERWFRLVEKVSTIIFSFIFFWGALFYLGKIEDNITHYLIDLSNNTGNDGYSAIEKLVKFVFVIVYIISILMPIAVTSAILRGDKVVDKKRYILQFIVRLLSFLRRLF